MLSQAVRPSAQAAACAACARQARRTAASRSSSRQSMIASYRPKTASARSTTVVTQRRGQASFAQSGERVTDDVERYEEGEQAAASTGEGAAEPAEAMESTAVDAGVQTGEGVEVFGEKEGPAQLAEEQVSSPPEQAHEAVKPTQALLDLLHSIQPEPAPKQDSPTASAVSEPSPSSSSAPSTDSRPSDPSDIPPVPSIPITLPSATPSRPQRGLNLPASHPQLTDLFALRPKRIRIPTADSPDSHRLVYAKDWTAALKRLTTAFTKPQLLRLAGSEGLEIDVDAPRMRTATPGRKGKGWRMKRLEQMSKNELAQAVLVGEFGLVHPDTVALNAKTGPQASETITLSNRTLFLLLSPNSPTIPNIARKLGVKTSFRRDPASGLIQLLLKGNQQSVDAAKEEVMLVDELKTVEYDSLTLPCAPTVLRPEVYQSISRQTKVFLEPPSPTSSSPTDPAVHSLSASALISKSLTSATRLLHSAFSTYFTSLSTALSASLPSSDTSPTTRALNLETRYSMVPVQPLVAPEPIRSGAATAFARVKALSKPVEGERQLQQSAMGAMLTGRSLSVEGETPPAGLAGEDLQAWRERMGLSPSLAEKTERSRVGLTAPAAFGQSAYAVEQASVWGLLKAPFAGAGEAQKVQVKARFGLVGWPLYPPSSPSGSGKGKGKKRDQQAGGLGPVLAGQWAFEKFREWVGFREREGVRGVFVASPPPNLLASTGVLNPLPSAPSSSPFASLFSSSSSTFDSTSLPDEQLSSLSSTPSLLSTSLRRWVYRPILHALPAGEKEKASRGEGKALESLVVESEVEGEGRKQEILKREIRVEKEGRVDMMVPTGAVDAQFSMTQTEVVEEANHPPEIAAYEWRSAPPITFTHNGVPYMLDTDRRIRRTVLTPPHSSSSSPSDSLPPFEQVQEAWTSLWPSPPGQAEGARGVDVFLAITPLAASEGGERGMSLEELQKSGRWRKGLEEVEARCLGGKGKDGEK
ncbi:hypothetical protein JCM11251_004792 [Rhodosporidiobolus azoricus]